MKNQTRKPLRRFWSVLIALVLGLSGGMVAVQPAQAVPPCTAASPDSSFACSYPGYGSYTGTWADTRYLAPNHNCTRYAAFRLAQRGVGDQGAWGNAEYWETAAASRGYAVNNTPAVGAIAQWEDSSAHPGGHVAHVDAVGNGWIEISDDSWGGVTRKGIIITTSGDWPNKFLHVSDISSGSGGVTRDVNADGRADLVIAGVGPSTSSGKLETHTLSGAGNYGSWLSHWVTAANYLGPNDRLVMGDVNADGRSDLVIVGTAGTGSGKLEVHALSGATGFSTWIGHWATPAGYLGANDRLAMADVNHDDRADLIIMATGPTGSGKFEAHVLNGATGFGSWLGNWITASNYSGSGDRQLAGDVNGDGKAEILIIGVGPSTGSGKIEVHALNGATNYGSWLGHWVTAAGYLGANDRLVMGDVNGDGKSDLVIVGTSGTGSGMLEVHALNGATNYSTWLGNWVSTSNYTGGTDVILMGG